MHEQAESHVAIDLDNRNPLPMARFESRIAVDRHLFKCERDLFANRFEHAPRAHAEVSATAAVENDLRLLSRVRFQGQRGA